MSRYPSLRPARPPSPPTCLPSGLKNFMRVMAFMFIPAGGYVAAGTAVLWVSNTAFGVVQGLTLRNDRFRRRVGLPTMQVRTCARVGVRTCGRVHVWMCARVHVWVCARVGVCACGRARVVAVRLRQRLGISYAGYIRTCAHPPTHPTTTTNYRKSLTHHPSIPTGPARHERQGNGRKRCRHTRISRRRRRQRRRHAGRRRRHLRARQRGAAAQQQPGGGQGPPLSAGSGGLAAA